MTKQVATIFKLYMGMKSIIDHDIVFNNTAYAFPQLDSPV
jgi:hypothetical protein